MNKNVFWLVVSILGSVGGFYVITQNASLGANISAGTALFLSGWSTCYRIGKYLGPIKD